METKELVLLASIECSDAGETAAFKLWCRAYDTCTYEAVCAAYEAYPLTETANMDEAHRTYRWLALEQAGRIWQPSTGQRARPSRAGQRMKGARG